MSKIFVTNRANKGLEVLAGKYQFLNGEMPASDEDAEKLAPILCRFYGCTMEEGSPAAYEEMAEADSVMLLSQAQAAQASGMAAAVEANIAAGAAAGDPRVTGTLSGPGNRIGPVPALNTAPNANPDPKVVSNQSIEAEKTNHENTGGVGSGPITGPTGKAPVVEDGGEEEEDGGE